MKIYRPLWEDGAALAPQQFQQQVRWSEHVANMVARMGISHPWGVVAAEFDDAALALSRLNAIRLVIRFQDGTIVDTDLADNIPPVCDLSAANGAEAVEVLAALPLLSASGGTAVMRPLNAAKTASHPKTITINLGRYERVQENFHRRETDEDGDYRW